MIIRNWCISTLLLVQVAVGALSSTTAPQAKPVEDEITRGLRAGLAEPAHMKAVEQAAALIHADRPQACRHLAWRWGPALLSSGDCDTLIRFTAQLEDEALIDGDLEEVLQRAKVSALMRSGMEREAKAAATILYAFASVEKPQATLKVVDDVLCSQEANGSKVSEYRLRQAAVMGKWFKEVDGRIKTRPALLSDYASTLDNRVERQIATKDPFLKLIATANAALLDGDRDRAAELFSKAYQVASNRYQFNAALKGIARSIRAIDGDGVRATAVYLKLSAQGFD